jgi:hypothetical protein
VLGSARNRGGRDRRDAGHIPSRDAAPRILHVRDHGRAAVQVEPTCFYLLSVLCPDVFLISLYCYYAKSAGSKPSIGSWCAARVTIGDKVQMVHENESVYVASGARHRLENPGKIDLELIEVQTGSYLGEDDIERIEDDYHRS